MTNGQWLLAVMGAVAHLWAIPGSGLELGTIDRPAAKSGAEWVEPGNAGAVGRMSGPGRTRQDSMHVPLTVVVQRTLTSYPSSAAARAERARAEAAVSEARSARFPRLALDAGGTRFQEPMIVAPLHGFDPQRPPGFDDLLVQARASASYTLFDGGVRGARVARSGAGVDAAVASELGTRSSLIERAVIAYLEVASAREIIAAHGARILALESERARARRLFEAGSVPRLALLRADAALSRAQADRAGAVAALRQAEAGLARLVGVAADTIATARLDVVRVMPGTGVPDRGEALERAIHGSAAVERARAQLAAADAGLSEARAALLPVLSINAGYNAFGSAAGDYVMEWQTALQLTYPVFTGGGRRAGIRRADAEAALAGASLRLAELAAESEVDEALTRLAASRAQVDALTVAVGQFEAVVEVETLSLEAGAGVQSDYLGAVSELLDARAALTRARASEVAARLSFARVVGELTEDWLIRNLEVE